MVFKHFVNFFAAISLSTYDDRLSRETLSNVQFLLINMFCTFIADCFDCLDCEASHKIQTVKTISNKRIKHIYLAFQKINLCPENQN